jgi:preprotein translocase subunit SecA
MASAPDPSHIEPVEDDGDDHACGDPHCDDHHETLTPFRRESPKVGRNDPCPCGSGKKHKKCCLKATV